MGQRTTLQGVVQHVIFTNADNGYTVLSLRVDDTDEEITVVGCIPSASTGESLTATGVWVNHPTYGQQFTAESVERRMPENEDDILSYLSSGVVKGIGPATALRLVERFGEDTLRVMEEEPERISTIKGITAKKAVEFSTALRQLTVMRHTMEFLQRYDLPVHLAMPLLRAYGNDAVARLKENPYVLTHHRFGVEFQVADAIGLSLGFDGDDTFRTEAAILYELQHNLSNGHVFLPREKLLAASCALIDMSEERAEQSLDDLIARHAVVSEPLGKVEACYLPGFYTAEKEVTEKLLRLRNTPSQSHISAEKVLSDLEQEQNITYAPAQREAVLLAAQTGALLLTGGPGTGKTTSVRAIVTLFERMGLDVLLLAPTGRAAMRMSELCGREALTVHRALGMVFNEMTGEVTFKKNENDPLACDAVIVDEMSMVDLELMHALLSALREGCRLVMVGDPDQLPSVGAGNVLGDMLRSEAVPTVRLRDIFRQAELSAIIRNAHAVNLGKAPDLQNKQNDFFFLCRRTAERTVSTVVELVAERLPKHMHIPSAQIQVITPTRKGDCGTENLNRALQAALNPPALNKRQKIWGDTVFRIGDRIMQTRNNYDVVWEKDDGTVGTGIFNGDVGVITDIDVSGELFALKFDERTVYYTADQLSELELAYAITVHKAQGSEYRAVVLVTAPMAQALQVRGVLYTAITRARELLVLVGDDTIPGRMAENDKPQRRYSGLRRRLKEANERG